jgi:ABC-type branched-subunit amino acid transport system substrate-binding protein
VERPVPSFRVGVIIPLQGPAGIFGPSCEAVTQLALTQLNDAGGIMGRPVEAEIIDGGARPTEIAETVRTGVRSGRLHALTGWHISAVRQRVAPVGVGHIPYVYTSLYEGGERRPGVFCCGETPPDQIAPALRWMRDEHGTRRVYVLGDDYVWPRVTARSVRHYADALNLTITAEQFIPLGTSDFEPVVRAIAASSADTVLMLLVGQDAVLFNRAFAARGLHAKIRRLTPLMEENMLLSSGAEATRQLFVSAAYFRSLATASAMELTDAYVRMHGAGAPPLNNEAESCYEGIRALAALIHRGGSSDPYTMTHAADGVGYDGPRGPMQMEGGNVRQHVYVAQATELDFEVLARL